MKKIYFIRHGQSEANVKKCFAGQKEDSPLTDLGREQATQAALDLLKNKIKVDRIISSPLIRARKTAEIIIKQAKLDLKLEIDKRLAEYDVGELAGTSYRQISSAEMVRAKGAEDPQKFKKRVQDFLDDLEQGKENVLIVSHAGVGRMIEVIRKNHDPKTFHDHAPLPNAKIFPIEHFSER
jgi:broad specificity phosphatase PhoE